MGISEGDRMTPYLFMTILAGLGWSVERAAAFLKVSPHQVSAWCSVRQPVPKRTAYLVRELFRRRVRLLRVIQVVPGSEN